MEYWNTGRMEEWVIHKNKILINYFSLKTQYPTILCLPAPVPTEGGAGRHYSNFKAV
jgi:hypothetical protein